MSCAVGVMWWSKRQTEREHQSSTGQTKSPDPSVHMQSVKDGLTALNAFYQALNGTNRAKWSFKMILMNSKGRYIFVEAEFLDSWEEQRHLSCGTTGGQQFNNILFNKYVQELSVLNIKTSNIFSLQQSKFFFSFSHFWEQLCYKLAQQNPLSKTFMHF